MAAWLPLASRRMYNTLGFQWASALMAFAALALTAAPVTLLFWGEKVRGRSRFIQEARYVGGFQDLELEPGGEGSRGQ